MSWVVRVSEHRHEHARAYDSPPHEHAADARTLAAIIRGRAQLTGAGPWREAIPGGQRTVSVQHTYDGRLF